MKTALVTGAFGQDGYFLTKYLIELKNYHIICCGNRFNKTQSNIYNNKNIEIKKLDIKNDYEIYKIIKDHKPDELYHLAGFSSPLISWTKPKEAIDVNGMSTITFLEAIRLFSPKTKIFFASSAKIFGIPTQPQQDENTPIDSQDPYSLGKYIGHQAVRLYRKKFNVFASNGILYNHESHLKNLNFVVYKICHYAKLLKQKKINKFSLLSFNSTIDFGDPRDYVEAMHLILQQDKPNDYIISMNNSISIKEICLKVGKLIGISDLISHIEVPESSMNENIVKFQGNNKKLKSIGWAPKFSINDTFKLILNNITLRY